MPDINLTSCAASRLSPTAGAGSVLLAALAMVAAAAPAQAQSGDASQLGHALTYAGAQAAGNSDGSIPAYEGVVPPAGGWNFGQFRGDFWKYKGERPQFTITAANAQKYASRLSPGQLAMFTARPGYQMDVYPSHRDCGAPAFVQSNTLANVGKAKVGEDGWSLQTAALPSVPFPLPKSGIEAMENFQTRYQGLAANWELSRTYIAPPPGGSGSIMLEYTQLFYYPWAKQGVQQPGQVGNLQNGTFYSYDLPNALAGQALVQRYYFDKAAESYYYFTGQRRVRRLPTYAYDAPIIGTENMYPNDAIQIFYGSPDRFDWKLLGKKELYVPYNDFQDFRLPFSLIGNTYPDPKLRRYELHRVWVLEGDVKAGVRHNTPRKVMYLDEDSWNAVAYDDYDTDNHLWHYREAFTWPDYEASTCTTAGMFASYDLLNGRYFADQILLGTGKDVKLEISPSEDRRLNDDFYSPENLRAVSER